MEQWIIQCHYSIYHNFNHNQFLLFKFKYQMCSSHRGWICHRKRWWQIVDAIFVTRYLFWPFNDILLTICTNILWSLWFVSGIFNTWKLQHSQEKAHRRKWKSTVRCKHLIIIISYFLIRMFFFWILSFILCNSFNSISANFSKLIRTVGRISQRLEIWPSTSESIRVKRLSNAMWVFIHYISVDFSFLKPTVGINWSWKLTSLTQALWMRYMRKKKKIHYEMLSQNV